jgi:hypothetical protein
MVRRRLFLRLLRTRFLRRHGIGVAWNLHGITPCWVAVARATGGTMPPVLVTRVDRLLLQEKNARARDKMSASLSCTTGFATCGAFCGGLWFVGLAGAFEFADELDVELDDELDDALYDELVLGIGVGFGSGICCCVCCVCCAGCGVGCCGVGCCVDPWNPKKSRTALPS